LPESIAGKFARCTLPASHGVVHSVGRPRLARSVEHAGLLQVRFAAGRLDDRSGPVPRPVLRGVGGGRGAPPPRRGEGGG
jgi:hypothetical protein